MIKMNLLKNRNRSTNIESKHMFIKEEKGERGKLKILD